MTELTSVATSVQRTEVGNGVFPRVASLLNHSCDPNTATVIVGQNHSSDSNSETVIVGLNQFTVASRTIEKGEEICHVYQEINDCLKLGCFSY